MSAVPAWVNGSFAGTVDAADRGLTLGDGVFDTLVAFGGEPFAGERHLQRLVAHAVAIGIDVAAERIQAGWTAMLARGGGEPCILRTTVTRGREGRGLWPGGTATPTLVVTASPWSPGLLGRPVRLVTSSIARNAGSPTSRLKTLNYLDNVLAARDAAEKGADDALLLNAAGRVACSTIANVFALFGDRLATPPGADGVMAGVLRAMALEASGAAGLRAEEGSLTPAALAGADAVFLTNSVRFLSPVTSLDGSPLPSRQHPAIARLAALLVPDQLCAPA
jgi:branched-chain amino acid aminotransferase